MSPIMRKAGCAQLLVLYPPGVPVLEPGLSITSGNEHGANIG
jgi:arginine/lysine/ornithine decarboxylase